MFSVRSYLYRTDNLSGRLRSNHRLRHLKRLSDQRKDIDGGRRIEGNDRDAAEMARNVDAAGGQAAEEAHGAAQRLSARGQKKDATHAL